MNIEERILSLRNKILSYLDSKEILSSKDIVSFYDLAEACKIEFGCYTNYFKKNINKIANKLNASSSVTNFIGNKVPYINKVVPGVKDMTGFITLYLSNNSGYYCGKMNIVEGKDTPELIDFNEKDFSDKKIIEYISKCYNEFSSLLVTLRIFKNDFGMDYTWDLDSPDVKSILNIGDGFIEGKIDLNKPDSSKVYLSNMDDMYLSTIKHTKHGEVHDYIDFYNQGLQKRFPIEYSSLNPLYKSIFEKHYEMNNSRKLTR